MCGGNAYRNINKQFEKSLLLRFVNPLLVIFLL